MEEKELNMISFFSVKICNYISLQYTVYLVLVCTYIFSTTMAASANYKNIIIVHDFDVGM